MWYRIKKTFWWCVFVFSTVLFCVDFVHIHSTKAKEQEAYDARGLTAEQLAALDARSELLEGGL